MRDDVADDVPEEEVLLVSSAAAAPPRELLPGEGGRAATVAGAGAPALRVLPAPDKGGKSWVESVFCEGTGTTGETSPLPAALGVTPWAPLQPRSPRQSQCYRGLTLTPLSPALEAFLPLKETKCTIQMVD